MQFVVLGFGILVFKCFSFLDFDTSPPKAPSYLFAISKVRLMRLAQGRHTEVQPISITTPLTGISILPANVITKTHYQSTKNR
jgi:hypothetical protein